MIIGITGGIGSGKSTVAKLFESFGAPVYYADQKAKAIMHENASVVNQIKNLFGELAYQNQQLNREYIAEQVFSDAQLLEKLNKIVHPAVREDFKEWVKKQTYPYVIQESALIFENQMQGAYDAVILVTAPLETRISRVMARDGVQRNQVENRIANQLSDAAKIPYADYILENNNRKHTQESVQILHQKFLAGVG